MAGTFLETIGIEIEGCGIPRDELSNVLQSRFGDYRNLFNIGNDASVQSNVKYITNSGNIAVFNHNTLSRLVSPTSNITCGYELTTLPLTFEMMEIVIPKIMSGIQSRGEINSPRASTHIHIGYVQNFNMMRNAFGLGLWIEPLMYKLGGMGDIFRGHINNSIYCRPLELSVAVLGENRKKYSLLDTESAKRTESSELLWKCYGIDLENYVHNLNRYHPARYFGFNLLSILLHGTIEFRYFNSCLNPKWILAVARLCQGITELSTKIHRKVVNSLERESILNHYSEDDYFDLLERLELLMDENDIIFNTNSKQKDTLREIISKSGTPKFNKVMPMTHLKSFYLPDYEIVTGLHKEVKETCESGFIDIHNIPNMNYSLI